MKPTFSDLVADALEVGDRLDDGDDDAQVGSGRLARRDDAPALLVDLDFHAVDLVVVPRHLLAELAVAVDQRDDRLLQLLLDEAAHLQHPRADPLQVFVEAPRDVLAEIRRLHASYSRPVMPVLIHHSPPHDGVQNL